MSTVGRYETLKDNILKSYQGAYDLILKNYGHNSENWKWGDAHALTHQHILSKVKILDYLLSLSVGPYKSGGSSLTPNAGGYAYGKSFKQTSGASMRRVVDLSTMNNTKAIIPTGQSGLQRSPHYDDQAMLYHIGKYRNTIFDEGIIRSAEKMRKLIFTPGE